MFAVLLLRRFVVVQHNDAKATPEILVVILTRSPHVSIPPRLSVRFGSFKPIERLQNASSHNNDI